MKFHKDMLLLYAVTDRKWTGRQTLYEQIEEALKGGATMIQLREKDLPESRLVAEAEKIKELCHSYHVPLIINDNVKAALLSGADGVHVGKEDMAVSDIRKIVPEDFIIGATAKTTEQAQKAEQGARIILGGSCFSFSYQTGCHSYYKRSVKRNLQRGFCSGSGHRRDHQAEYRRACGRENGRGSRSIRDFFRSGYTEGNGSSEEKNTGGFKSMSVHAALTIAGSDSSGGAGIQADIKTMITNGVYAMSAITALTAQNTTGVRSVMEVPPEFLGDQLDAVFEDIYPEAVKIGMVSSKELIQVIGEKLRFYQAKNVVVDPVMVASSGSSLMKNNGAEMMIKELFPLASLITPNIPEAEILSGCEIKNKQDMEAAAEKLSDLGAAAVLLKGGHSISDADDLLCVEGQKIWIRGRRIHNPNTHGTGCTLSSAIASNLAKGMEMEEAVRKAKEYISKALEAGLDLGKGSGPLDHAFYMANL